MKKVTFLTCTGGRPELFALCRRWVLRQTVQPTRWVVTTDCDDLPHAPEAEVIQIPKDYVHPPCDNVSPALRALSFGIQQMDDDSHVVVFEDDDWYGPRYVETLLAADHWCPYQENIGQFHLPTSKFNYSLYTAGPVEGMLCFSPGNRDRILNWLMTHPRPPLLKSKRVPMCQLVQVKGVGYGLPGRAGQTHKHVTNHRKVKIMQPDPDHRKFRSLVGEEDAQAYLSLLQPCH